MARGRKRKPRIDATGRNPDRTGSKGRFLLITRSLWHSPQVAALSRAGRALFVELHSMFNGANNGEIFLSVRDAADRLGFNNLEAASSAIAELVQLKLLAPTKVGAFRVKTAKGRRATAFRLNWIGDDGLCVAGDKLPTLDFPTLSARQKRQVEARSDALDRYLREQQGRKFAVPETGTLMGFAVSETEKEAVRLVPETGTINTENGGKPTNVIVPETDTHIYTHARPANAGDAPKSGTGIGRVCDNCGQGFEPKTWNQRYCSVDCCDLSSKRKWEANHPGIKFPWKIGARKSTPTGRVVTPQPSGSTTKEIGHESDA